VEQLQIEVIPVIQGAGHVNTTFFQQNGTRPNLYNEFGSHVLSNQFPERFENGWSWPPCSPVMKSCDYFLWGYLKDRVYRTDQHTV